jgi:hypothetical protein
MSSAICLLLVRGSFVYWANALEDQCPTVFISSSEYPRAPRMDGTPPLKEWDVIPPLLVV